MTGIFAASLFFVGMNWLFVVLGNTGTGPGEYAYQTRDHRGANSRQTGPGS